MTNHADEDNDYDEDFYCFFLAASRVGRVWTGDGAGEFSSAGELLLSDAFESLALDVVWDPFSISSWSR